MWDNVDIDKSPKIYEAVKQFLHTEAGVKYIVKCTRYNTQKCTTFDEY